jgi:hypothetical protein
MKFFNVDSSIDSTQLVMEEMYKLNNKRQVQTTRGFQKNTRQNVNEYYLLAQSRPSNVIGLPNGTDMFLFNWAASIWNSD